MELQDGESKLSDLLCTLLFCVCIFESIFDLFVFRVVLDVSLDANLQYKGGEERIPRVIVIFIHCATLLLIW